MQPVESARQLSATFCQLRCGLGDLPSPRARARAIRVAKFFAHLCRRPSIAHETSRRQVGEEVHRSEGAEFKEWAFSSWESQLKQGSPAAQENSLFSAEVRGYE